jgi:hypothetical protein
MSLDEEKVMFGMGEGCPTHGDEEMRECPTCGIEYCAKCYPGRVFCPDCSADPAADPDLEDDFDGDESRDEAILGELPGMDSEGQDDPEADDERS